MTSIRDEQNPARTPDEAKARGLKRYFTGEPCRRGHVAERDLLHACMECRKLTKKKYALKKQGKAVVLAKGSEQMVVLNPRPNASVDGAPKQNPWEWRKNYFFSRTMANRIIKFFETRVVHIEGDKAGKPFVLERWQRKVLRRAFGWYNRADGYRKFRVIWIEVPRKNGKSALASGIALYLAFEDMEPGAQVVSAAAETEQAGIVFNVAKSMVERNQKMTHKVKAFKKTLVDYGTASTYKVISAEAYSKHGKNLHGIICDEVHAQPNRELIDVLRTSTGARRQPMQVYLTTAGYDKLSVCWEMHQYARDLIDGVIEDPTFLPVIFAADEEDDWTDEKTWFKANPNLGVSKQLAYMRQECEVAKKLPSYENTFKRLELNIWTEQESRWMPMNRWNECSFAVDPKELEGRTCVAAADLSSTEDITALVLLFKMDNGKYKVLPFFWLPGETASKRAKSDKVPYPTWIAQGFIQKTEGDQVDYSFIKAKIIELSEIYHIHEIAYDKWNATQLMTDLQGEGFEVVPIRQGYGLSSSCKELLKLTLAKEIAHAGNPVLKWMAKNAAVVQNGEGDIRLSKKKSKERIDGLVALVMALDRQMRIGDSKSVYEERGLVTVG